MRRLWGALLISLVAAALCIPAPVVAAEEIGDLAGVTHFAGSHSGGAVMNLPAAVEISSSPFRNKLTSIRSTGRVAGLVMKQDIPEGGVEVIAHSLALCDSPPCTQKRVSVTHVWDPGARGFPRKVTLPAGNYFVYLIAEGETEVDLNLPGLEGEADAALTNTDTAEIVEPKMTFDPLSGHNVYSAEAKLKLEGMGYGFIALDIKTDTEVFGNVETCLQHKKMDPVIDNASVPLVLDPCNGSGSGSTYVANMPGTHRHVILSLSTIGRGTWFESLRYKSVATSNKIMAVAGSISFPRGKRTGGFSSGTWWDD